MGSDPLPFVFAVPVPIIAEDCAMASIDDNRRIGSNNSRNRALLSKIKFIAELFYFCLL